MGIPGDMVADHLARFVAMLDREFRRYGARDGMPAPLREAVVATPRHRFVHRFRIEDGDVQDFDADPQTHLRTVYSDRVMRHLDAAGEALPSSNSQPSYILWLLHLLRLEPGQRVLEIGSGSGWLAAVMARLVAPDGQVTGIEIIPELAAQSRADLSALGLAVVSIFAEDGTLGHPAGAPFDRVIITAATWDLPAALFAQVAEGGLLLVPIALRGGGGCQVSVLRRRGTRFIAERSVPGWFVPLVGQGQEPAETRRAPDRAAPRAEHAWPLGSSPGQFREFLGRTEPGFATFGTDAPRPQRRDQRTQPFGVVDDAAHAMALWDDGKLIAYGGDAAARRLALAYRHWTDLGMPGFADFDLEVVQAGKVSAPPSGAWIEPRGHSVLIWRLKPGLGSWQGYLSPGQLSFNNLQ